MTFCGIEFRIYDMRGEEVNLRKTYDYAKTNGTFLVMQSNRITFNDLNIM